MYLSIKNVQSFPFVSCFLNAACSLWTVKKLNYIRYQCLKGKVQNLHTKSYPCNMDSEV